MADGQWLAAAAQLCCGDNFVVFVVVMTIIITIIININLFAITYTNERLLLNLQLLIFLLIVR